MITKNDIEILKEIFVTKDEFRMEIGKLHKKIDNNSEKMSNKIDIAVSEIKEIIQALLVPVLKLEEVSSI